MGFKQIDLIDSANHRWFAYQVDADNVVNADLDGDGSAEVVTLKRDYTPHSKERIKVSAFSNEGKPLWTYTVDNNLIKRSLASKIVAADLNGDGRDEVLLSFSSGFLVLNADGKAMPNPPKVKIAGLDTGDLCPTKPWIAVSNSIGSVQVINVQTGKSIASIDGQIGSHRMAWMTTAAGHPLLIISKSKSIDAYRIESD